MNEYIVKIILGLLVGFFYGITGIIPISLIILILGHLNIGNHTTNLGAIALLNLLPLSLGAFVNFYKTNNIDYYTGFILGISIIIGGYIGSEFVINSQLQLSKKNIYYITSIITFMVSIGFLYRAIIE